MCSCEYASLATSRNTTYETAAYSKKCLSTLLLAECFHFLRSRYDFLFVNEVFSFLFQSSLDVFRWVVRERQAMLLWANTANSTDATDMNKALPASVLLASVPVSHIVDANHQRSSAALALPSSSSQWWWQ